MIMTFNRDKAFSGECCVDCLMLLANGETNPEWSQAECDEYLARVAEHTAGTDVTPGMFREDHPCAVNFTVTYAPTRYSRRRLTVEVRADDIADARERAYWELPAGARITGYPRRHDLATMADLGGECECEQTTFSWSPCDVCGSHLGGAREAVVFWPQPDAAPPAPETCPACAAEGTNAREHFAIVYQVDQPYAPSQTGH
jgi:hypothetical protein